jgi:hypothetical protein
MVMAMKIFFSRQAAALVLALAASASMAQDKAADKVDKTEKAASSVPKHGCVRPDAPAKFENDGQQKLFVKQMDGYRDCLMAYRNDMNKVAQAHIDAANAAIEEFNSFVNTINKK